MPTAPTSAAELIALIKKSGIVAPDRVSYLSTLALPDQPQTAAATLVAQGIVTNFQASQLLVGRHKGFRIGAYTVLDMLGRGGMGAVYLAEHNALHRKVAIKILLPGKNDDQRLALERFQREARSVAALDHPNIVRIFDVAQHNGVPYLVMEYVEGETLQHVLDREGRIPFSTAVEYVAQATAGLQHAFERGLVHRDIKPCNLIRDKSDTVKILDMGLARTANASDMLTAQLDKGAVVGTADFIAPEQALNNPSVDIRADIYALGATLFSLIVGKPPFAGNTTQKLLQHQLKSAPTLASIDATLPKGLSQVTAKMLAKKPEDRYQTPAEVLNALTPWLTHGARVLVGLSRTSLAADDALQDALAGIQRTNSSQRHSPITESSVTHELGALEFDRETGTLASARTTRESSRLRAVPSRTQASKRWVIGAIACAIAAVAGLVSWLVFVQR